MNKYLKWTLWILGALILVAAFFAVGYFAFTHWNAGGWMMAERGEKLWDNGRQFPWRNMPMRPDRLQPGMRFFGFSILGMILGGLFRLLILALIIAGVVALIRYLTRSNKVVQVAPAAASAAAVTPVSVESKNCPNCGRTVQADWAHCPYCGTSLV